MSSRAHDEHFADVPRHQPALDALDAEHPDIGRAGHQPDIGRAGHQPDIGRAVTCSRTFPAASSQLREAREFLAEVLDSSLLAPDALLCLSELVTNAIEHSRSARAGGLVTVRATREEGTIRVEVEDEGGPWQPRTRDDPQRGRGLLIVAKLAHRWEISGDGTSSRTVSFELR